ncbi:unnamed protein product [Pneumocystis jirovecii]|uniref:Uncharacterized protein n=1 Tax=Pneumocystis jirovecii TaxID=42068 RepID=L0PDA3_PNEJI|nr:unnamed protein product [Pneumocystis jirovecii]
MAPNALYHVTHVREGRDVRKDNKKNKKEAEEEDVLSMPFSAVFICSNSSITVFFDCFSNITFIIASAMVGITACYWRDSCFLDFSDRRLFQPRFLSTQSTNALGFSRFLKLREILKRKEWHQSLLGVTIRL